MKKYHNNKYYARNKRHKSNKQNNETVSYYNLNKLYSQKMPN